MFDGFNLREIHLRQGINEISPDILNLSKHVFDESTGEIFEQKRLGLIKGLRFDENLNATYKRTSLRGSFIRRNLRIFLSAV